MDKDVSVIFFILLGKQAKQKCKNVSILSCIYNHNDTFSLNWL